VGKQNTIIGEDRVPKKVPILVYYCNVKRTSSSGTAETCYKSNENVT